MREKPLARLAFRPGRSIGRKKNLPGENVRTCIKEDTKRIVTSASFMRAGQRKQVFDSSKARINSRGGHILQTQEVARNLAESLGLSIELSTAIALAHDLGHPALCHSGEVVLNEFLPGFCHEKFGVILLQEIEPLNLTYEVLNGILHHSLSCGVMEDPTVIREYRVVTLADKIAYTFYDLADFQFMVENAPGLLPIPAQEVQKRWRDALNLLEPFGSYLSKYEWIEKTCKAVVEESIEVGDVSFCHCRLSQRFMELRSWMYQNLYIPLSNPEEELQMIREVVAYLVEHSDGWDYDPLMLTALMVDSQIKALHRLISGEQLYSYEWGNNIDDLLFEMVMWDFHRPLPKKGKINLVEPDLSWARAKT